MHSGLYKTLIILAIFCLTAISTSILSNIKNNQSAATFLSISNPSNSRSHIIIVDMGSTGTRMHVYKIHNKFINLYHSIPYIKEIANAKSQDRHAVADYSNNPKNIKKHMLPLYKDITNKLKPLNININSIPIYFYATAGMRLYDQEIQNKIYQELIASIKQAGHKSLYEARTIPGELEGIFDWLSVNYKLQTIQNNKPTIAAFDMGGASTQVAMEYVNNDVNKHKDNNIYKINFNNKEYKVYSKSMLGYGLTQTKKSIVNYSPEKINRYCKIKNKDPDNKNTFNFDECEKLISTYLNTKTEHLEIAQIINSAIRKNMKIIAASGYYYNFKAFNSRLPKDLIQAIPSSCHHHKFKFKNKFPDLLEKEMNEACFDATYLKVLLSNGYNIPENYRNFTIPNIDIDWTMGAALFISTKQKLYN